jgi:hypothetical protein
MMPFRHDLQDSQDCPESCESHRPCQRIRRCVYERAHLRFANRFREGGHSCPPRGGLEAGAAGWKTRAVSLRAKRSNLGSRGNGDCFASLAMTQRGHRAPSLLRKTEMRPL